MRGKKLIVVCGPTASGKTALSIGLAKAFSGEVVSADSMQIYRGMDIGTAKPTAAEMEGVPHHMLDVAEPGEDYSVSRYTREAAACVEDILRRGKQPIVCGGTGLYIDGLLRGTEFQPCGVDLGLREALEEQWQQAGPAAMMARLAQADPESAARLHINDKRRILRALEVYQETGETITQHDRRTREQPPRYEGLFVGLNFKDRQDLRDRIDRRVDDMVAQGLLDEVRSLLRSGLPRTATAWQAIGYKQFLAVADGRMTEADAVEEVKLRSRQYAKRQLTWLRRNEAIHWVLWDKVPDFPSGLQNATTFLTSSGVC